MFKHFVKVSQSTNQNVGHNFKNCHHLYASAAATIIKQCHKNDYIIEGAAA